MVLSLLKQSFVNQKKAMALMIISVAMGTAVSASLISVSMNIKGKISRELRSFGANITVEPRVEGFADIAGQRRYLREEDIIKSKTIFWRHNILGVAPFLDSSVIIASPGGPARKAQAVGTWFKHDMPLPGEAQSFAAGVVTVSPWWYVDGEFPTGKGVVLGAALAAELGAEKGGRITVDGEPFDVTGILSVGGREDEQAFFDLGTLQAMKGMHGAVSRVQVSALTTPMDDFAYKDPDSMSTAEYEKWYCTGYVTSIAKQLEEVFQGSTARPIWHVAETEGQVLGRMSVLVYLLTAAALIAAAIGMSTTMAASLLKRLDEIGLMKALGADSYKISSIFLTEAFVIGVIGGVLGYGMSIGVVKLIGDRVFSSALEQRDILLLAALLSSFAISTLGAMLPIRRALKVKPAIVLKESH